MTDGRTNEDGEKLEVVRKNADKLRTVAPSRTDLYKGTYTRRWKDICRDLLIEYAKLSSEATDGKPIGATTIRKHILREIEDKKMTLTANNIFDFCIKTFIRMM